MIGLLINDRLNSYAPLNPLVSNRISPIIAEDESMIPYITYNTRIGTPDYAKIGLLNSSVVDNIEIAIEIVSSSYRELQEIISLVRDAIEFQQFEHNGVMTRQSFLRSITETYSNNTRNYMGAVLFNVSTNRLTF
jgi:hypothetical protein